MSQVGRSTTVHENGVEKPAYTVSFTNGALAELESLQQKLGAPDLDSVIRIAIGVIRRISESNEPRSSE
jgi:hypothetical protein